eukprot:5980190-Pyramimonas_sp.AAC.1
MLHDVASDALVVVGADEDVVHLEVGGRSEREADGVRHVLRLPPPQPSDQQHQHYDLWDIMIYESAVRSIEAAWCVGVCLSPFGPRGQPINVPEVWG